MRRKGHLCLIGGTSTPVSQEFRLSVAEVSKTDKKYSAQSRMRAAEEELIAMREVTDAAFFLMRSLPMDQLELQELMDLYEMFVSGEDVLNLYTNEFAQLSLMRLTPIEMKQLNRLRKIHYHLSDIVPEASETISEVIKKFKASKKPKGTNKSVVALHAVPSPVAVTTAKTASRKTAKKDSSDVIAPETVLPNISISFATNRSITNGTGKATKAKAPTKAVAPKNSSKKQKAERLT